MRHRHRAAPPGPSPAERLLMFAIALNGDRARRRMKQLGVTAAELEGIFSGSEQELAEARQLNIAAAVMTRERLGALLRARIGELALTATKAGELAALARALERLPDWALDGAEDEYWDTAQRDPEPRRTVDAAPAPAVEPEPAAAAGRAADAATPGRGQAQSCPVMGTPTAGGDGAPPLPASGPALAGLTPDG